MDDGNCDLSKTAAPLLTCMDDHDLSKMEQALVISVPDYVVDDEAERDNSWFIRPNVAKVAEEIKQLFAIAFPMILTGLVVYAKSAISMFFMGKIGKDALSCGSLGIGIANIAGYSVLSGLAAGMEGISSQACGAQLWPLMGQTLQRTIIILILTCIPITILWLNIEPFLITLGLNPNITCMATTYLTFSIPNLILQAIINPLKIYLRAQKITFPLMFCAAFSLSLHAPINYIFTFRLNLGIRGIALAAALTDFNMLTILLLHLSFSGICQKSWQGWSFECFKEWRPIILQAIPSCISICLEWWWYELMIVLSVFFRNGSESVASMGILIQATSLIYNFPFALNQAVSTRVGNELGANRPDRARFSSVTALFCAIVTGFMAMLFMVTTRNSWGKIFTDDGGIEGLVAAVLPVVGLCELWNCPQTTMCGVLRGGARPGLGVVINLGSFYGVGFPVGVLMGFKMGLGLQGLWVGLLSAQVSCACMMMVVLMRTDWKVQTERARERIESINIEDDDNLQAALIS